MAWREDLMIMKSLFLRDFYVLKKEFASDAINLVTWPVSLAISFGYVLPACGMTKEVGSFLLVGAIATAYFYLAIGIGTDFVGDLESFRCIESQLIIPISSYKILFIQKIISFALHATALSVPMLPIGKLVLPSQLDLTHFSLLKFLLAALSCGIFFGCFGFLLASFIKSVRAFGNVWRRVYTPMLMCGAYWFSFQMAYDAFGAWAYLMLLNPLTFMTESIRVSVFGQANYLNYWHCIALLVVSTLIFGWVALYNLKKRLDVL